MELRRSIMGKNKFSDPSLTAQIKIFYSNGKIAKANL